MILNNDYCRHCNAMKFQVDSTPSEEAPPTYSLESFINLNPRSDPSVTSMLDSPELARERIRRNCKHMRILQEYKRDINMKLREGLQWMFENGLKPKLEGRYKNILILYRYYYCLRCCSVFSNSILHYGY